MEKKKKGMRQQSIKLRMLVSTLVALLVLLAGGGLALSNLFEQHVERRVERELFEHLDRLTAMASFDSKGLPALNEKDMATRFMKPYGGLYWQINGPGKRVLASPSLWDQRLELPKSLPGGSGIAEYKIKGPEGQDLLVAMRNISRKSGDKLLYYRFATALDHDEITHATIEFSSELALGLGGLAVILALLTWLQIGYGLRPLTRLAPTMHAISSGHLRRFPDDNLKEIKPLVEQLNKLLEQQELVMERSRTRAASLAHGLKTPLSAIDMELRKLPARERDVADRVKDQLGRMNRQVERELVRTRIRGATHGVRRTNPLRPMIEDVMQAVARLPRGEQIKWTLSVAEDVEVALDTDDLAEIFGNLLDNARKWAKGKVMVSARRNCPKTILVQIADDGPGLPADKIKTISERGMRLDDDIEGSGLGLAIVMDVLAACGGEMSAGRSSLGGLALSITLPAAY